MEKGNFDTMEQKLGDFVKMLNAVVMYLYVNSFGRAQRNFVLYRQQHCAYKDSIDGSSIVSYK